MRHAACPEGHTHLITIDRRTVGHAYARNGNLHNPTPRYMYAAIVDDNIVASCTLERDAVAIAEDFITTGEVHGS
jgi:hypothetical protein